MARVRVADARDVPRIVDMIEALREAVSGPVPVDRNWTIRTVSGLIRDPAGCVFVTDGGFIAGLMQPTVISPAPIAKEVGWWAGDGSGLRLLRAFEAWALEQGAQTIQLSTAPEGPDLSRLGYGRAELAWVR
ncbi:hypothetical protein [Thioclava sp. GXIMD2076]|uniref:hypothetical protein n=1 Tax=Thioclava sp. GXIMD2076 TaxID=3131931 RepID=UPI0030CF1358